MFRFGPHQLSVRRIVSKTEMAQIRRSSAAGAHLPIDGSIWMPAVARASCPWVWVKPSDMGKMPMPLAPPSIGRCAPLTAATPRIRAELKPTRHHAHRKSASARCKVSPARSCPPASARLSAGEAAPFPSRGRRGIRRRCGALSFHFNTRRKIPIRHLSCWIIPCRSG